MAFFRRIVEDYEARLAAPAGLGRATGKAEHERFEDGEVQFEVRVRDLEVADGSELDLSVNGATVARAAVTRGRLSLRLSSRTGHTIPIVRAGDRLEVLQRSAVLLAGVFQPD